MALEPTGSWERACGLPGGLPLGSDLGFSSRQVQRLHLHATGEVGPRDGIWLGTECLLP